MFVQSPSELAEGSARAQPPALQTTIPWRKSHVLQELVAVRTGPSYGQNTEVHGSVIWFCVKPTASGDLGGQKPARIGGDGSS